MRGMTPYLVLGTLIGGILYTFDSEATNKEVFERSCSEWKLELYNGREASRQESVLLKKENAVLKEQISALKSDIESGKNNSNADSERYLQQIDQLTHQMSQLSSGMHEQDAALKKFQNETQRLKNLIGEKEATLVQVRQQKQEIENSRTEMENLLQKIATLCGASETDPSSLFKTIENHLEAKELEVKGWKIVSHEGATQNLPPQFPSANMSTHTKRFSWL